MTKRPIKQIFSTVLPFAIVFILTAVMLLSFFLDNKYFNRTPDYKDGYTKIVAENLSSPYALTDNWHVYEGLLSPAEVLVNQPAETNIRLGDESNLYRYIGTSLGSVTYRIILSGNCPDAAILIPQPLSSSKVYIGGKLMGETGDVINGKSFIKDRIYYFEITAHTEIVIQVTNLSHGYGGLYYPPLLGMSDSVTDAYYLRLMLHIIIIAFVLALLLLGLPFLYFSKHNKKIYLPFAFVCLFTAISLLNPIFSALGTSVPLLTFTITNTASSALLLFAMVLLGTLCGFSKTTHFRYAAFPAAIGLTLFTLVMSPLSGIFYGFTASFGYIISALKLCISLYLTVNSVMHFAKSDHKLLPRTIMAGSLAYSVSMILSIVSIGFFEPIYGLWFEEYGSVILTLIFSGVLLILLRNTTSENITLNKNLNAEIDKKTRTLNAIFEDRHRFLNSITHDLKTPITAVRSYAELVSARKNLDDDTRRSLSIMISRLDDFSTRFGLLEWFNKDTVPDFTLIDINAFIQDYYETNKDDIEMSGVNFVYKLCKPTLQMYADKIKLSRVFENLVYNSLSFCTENDTITISLEKENNHAVIKVIDTGKGISDDIIPYIFQPYFSKRDDDTGEGLGLYIVNMVVSEHQGTITVTSTENVKTEFVIRFPLNTSD